MNVTSKTKVFGIIVLSAIILTVTVACGEEKVVDNSQYYIAAPTGVVATKLSDNSIHITWNAVSGVSHYEISARTNLDSSDTRIKLTTTTNTSTDHGYYYWYWGYYSRPEEVTTIYYYVKAHPRQSGYIASGWSNPDSVMVR